MATSNVGPAGTLGLAETAAAAIDRIMKPSSLIARSDTGAEWWYYHGHLRDGDRHFGFHLALFRVRTDGMTVGGVFPLRLATKHIWFAHFAITDLAMRRFHYGQLRRSTRSGAAEDRYEVWVGDWRLGGDATRHRASAQFGDIACQLELTTCKPPICHRDVVSSGDASHWSYTRMQADGMLSIDGRSRRVVGEAWMDREYGAQLLDACAAAWNWFGIQLDDGRELMLYDFYDNFGNRSPQARACIVEADGSRDSLSAEDFQLRPCEHWTSPRTGCTYPILWQLSVPSRQLELSIRPYLRDHELDTYGSTSLIYWEGPAEVYGRSCERPTGGRCFIELVGYDRCMPRPHRFDFCRGNWSVAGYALSEWRKWAGRKGIVNAN